MKPLIDLVLQINFCYAYNQVGTDRLVHFRKISRFDNEAILFRKLAFLCEM